MRVAVLVAARPNFVKTAPLIRALVDLEIEVVVVHAGQHYDDVMSGVFLEELDIPEPTLNLGVGSGTHAYQTAATILGVERFLESSKPDALVVAGDVNATMGGAIAAAKAGVALVHLEAGLRSFDRSMPEEINRVVADHLSDLCLAPSEEAVDNLKNEGIRESRIVLVGNCMIDTLLDKIDEARARAVWKTLGQNPGEYAVLTLHRPSNVDNDSNLARLVGSIVDAAYPLEVIFPVHPRTAKRLGTTLSGAERKQASLRLVQPFSYVDFLSLLSSSRIVFTDSGGIQEETAPLGIPCITLRNNTERPITISMGTNRLGGTDRDSILEATKKALDDPYPNPKVIPLWDGKAGVRGARAIVDFLHASNQSGRPD